MQVDSREIGNKKVSGDEGSVIDSVRVGKLQLTDTGTVIERNASDALYGVEVGDKTESFKNLHTPQSKTHSSTPIKGSSELHKKTVETSSGSINEATNAEKLAQKTQLGEKLGAASKGLAGAITVGAKVLDDNPDIDSEVQAGSSEAAAKGVRVGWKRVNKGNAFIKAQGKSAVIGKKAGKKASKSAAIAGKGSLKHFYTNTMRTAAAKVAAAAKGVFAAITAAATSIALPVIIAILAFVLSIVFLIVLLTGTNEDMSSLEGFNDNERIVATYLLDKGLDNVHVAAIMGNMYAESGINPGSIEAGNSIGHGICQWSYGRWNGPGGLLEFASAQGKEWTDIAVQLDFFWTEYSGNWSGNYMITAGIDPPSGTRVNGSKSGFIAAKDVKQATKEFCYGWERPGIPHETVRVSKAEEYFRILEGSGVGKAAVVEAAYKIAKNETPYIYGGNDIWGGCDCSYFTQWCYAQAGISIPRTDITQKAAGTVIPISEAQAGDLLWMPGHIGIYIDANTVIEQTPPYCRVTSITYNKWVCAVRID